MADKVTFAVSCTPQEELTNENSGTTFVIASEVNKSLGGSGTATVVNYAGTAANQGYLNATVNYFEALDSADDTDLSSETSATFIFIKNTGYAFSSATALGSSLSKALKIMGPGGTTLISILDPGELIVLKDDNAGLDGRFHVRTVDLDGSNNTSAGHLASRIFGGRLMTVLEIMERLGTKEETLVKAWVKDAIHLIQSSTKEKVEVAKRDIIKSVGSEDNIYILPSDLVSIENISIKDTSDSKFKKIRRLTSQPHYLAEDISP